MSARRVGGAAAQRPPAAAPVDLRTAAAALYDDLRLSRILSRLLDESGDLLGVAAGSVSLVDRAQACYAKAAERGAACQLGRSFPLDEGITGRVAETRRPVVLRRYSDVPAGHLPADHPASQGAVAAVPIWWRGEVLGVNVAFAGEDRRFSTAEVDQLEVLSQVGAAGIAAAAAGDPAMSVLVAGPSQDAGSPSPLVVTEVGAEDHRDDRTTARARALVTLVERDVLTRDPAARLRVVLLHQQDRLRVVVHDERGALSTGTTSAGSAAALQDLQRTWTRALPPGAGTLHVERVPGWGGLVLVELPHTGPGPSPPPLSGREQEVLGLLARGLTDRQVAEQLVLSRKTVEKHVGAVLRKTGTTSRTAAVVRALEQGWLPGVGRHVGR